MKSICPFTGITYPTPGFSVLRNPNYPHPIFSMPVKPLLAMAGKWSAGELDNTEKHLLFVAILSKLDLVVFKSPATPSLQVMEQNFELLIQLAIWKTNSLLPNLGNTKLPRFIVEYPTTHSLDKLRVFLKILLEAKNGYQSKYLANYNQRSTAEMRANEEKLKRLVNSGIARSNTKNIEKALAKFALDASGISPSDHRYDFWIELFQVKEPDIYQISPKHFHKMRDYLQAELVAYTEQADIRAIKVLQHVSKLVKIVDDGPAAYYDIHDISLTHASEYMEQLKSAVMDHSVEMIEPIPNSFRDAFGRVNMVAFMTAKSKWIKAVEYKRLMSEKTNEMKRNYQSISIEETKDVEDMDIDRSTPIDMLIGRDIGIEIMTDMED